MICEICMERKPKKYFRALKKFLVYRHKQVNSDCWCRGCQRMWLSMIFEVKQDANFMVSFD